MTTTRDILPTNRIESERTVATAPQTSPASLLAMSEDAFRRLVDADLRGKGSPEITQALRSPEVVDRWCASLSAMSKSVEGQLAAKKADAEAMTLEVEGAILQAKENNDLALVATLRRQLNEQRQKDAKWRAGVVRFKTGLEEAMTQAMHLRDALRSSVFESAIAAERNYAQARVRLLEQAIRSHRDHDCNQDTRCSEDHCASDDDLWQLVS